jgi:alpha-1,2-mannosyltransferase
VAIQSKIFRSRMLAAWYVPDRVIVILISVLSAVVIFAAADIAVWWANDFKITKLNGGTVRHYRNMNYQGVINRTNADSWGPMQRAIEVLEGPRGSELYEEIFFRDKLKFQYAPTSLVYYLALQHFGLTDVTALNNINAALVLVEATLVLWLFYLCLQRMWGEPPRWLPAQYLVLLTGAVFLFYPLVRAYCLGQIQIWLDVLFTAACICWLKDRRLLAGVMIGLAATIKPQLGLFLVWGLLWRQWTFSAGVLGSALAVGLVSLALFGLHNNLEYLRVLSFIGSHGEIYQANQSINGLLNRLVFLDISNTEFEAHEFAPYSFIVASLTLATTLLLVGLGLKGAVSDRRRGPNIFDFGLLAICATIASPIAWEHHYGVLLPLFVIALAALNGQIGAPKREIRVLALLAASWILVSNHFAFFAAFKNSWLNILQSHTLMGGLMLILVYLYLLRHGPPLIEEQRSHAAAT